MYIYKLTSNIREELLNKIDRLFNNSYDLIEINRDYKGLNYMAFVKNETPIENLSEVEDVTWMILLLEWANKYDISEHNIPRAPSQLIKIKILNLSNKGLTELPSEIGYLTSLTNIQLNDNKLSKLPKEICNLVNLNYLNLSKNELTKLPQNIDKLVNLTTLQLSHNRLTSTPKSLARLTKITVLALDNNRIKKQSVENEVLNFFAGDIAHRLAGVRKKMNVIYLIEQMKKISIQEIQVN